MNERNMLYLGTPTPRVVKERQKMFDKREYILCNIRNPHQKRMELV